MLYNIFIQLYRLGFKFYSSFNTKAKLGWDGRKNWKKNLKDKINPKEDWIWMHCSSLGEFEQGRPVLEDIKKKYPNYKLALSFFSASGYEIRKDFALADLVFYLPFDTSKNAKKLAAIFQPKIWILSKYDYWYNHLKFQSLNGTKIIVISAIFRQSQIFFQPYGKWFARQLKRRINHFFVQNQSSQTLLRSIDISATISGDTRFDRVKTIAKNTEQLDWVEEFKGNQNLIVIGSSWKQDENLWLNYIHNHLPKDWKVIFVPHEIKPDKIQQLKQSLYDRTILYSEIQHSTFNIQHSTCIIVDTIGLLSKIYASADIAYVGGGFNKSGVHNTLEPAVFGIPIIIGPNYEKFDEVKNLKIEGIVFPISNQEELNNVATDLIHDSEKRNLIKNKSISFFKNQPASTQIILDFIEDRFLN